MASNESSSVPARLKDLKDLVKERFLGLLGIRQPKVLLEDEQEVFLQVGRTVWHAPRQLRIELWLSSLARRHSLVSEYQTYLAQDIAREASVDIEKDVQRTFPNTRRFHAEEGQTQLRNVLRAYAAYDPEVAYCQGMNFLTGLLLMYLPSEAHAFAALVVLMEDRKLRSFYHRSMALLQVQLWQLSRLISPSLNQHLEAMGVVPMLYGASWLMTAFSADFPIPFSARIMDVLLADQCECALLKVAAAIMKAVEPRLKEMHDLENVLGHLKIEVPAWDEQDLHDVLTAAFTKPWTNRQLTILRSTEGAETVAQAMDRVMTMNEQLNSQTCDDDDGAEDGDVADARVAVTIPRLQPPPQPSSSFTVSPACGTPVNGGMYGTGSHGGASFSSPHAVAAAAAVKCSSFTAGTASSSAGGAGCGASSSGGAGATVGAAGAGAVASGAGTAGGSGGLLLRASSSVGVASPSVWSIPCIHPNVPASPAIQAFRRAHLPVFQAAVAAGAMGRNGGCHNPHSGLRFHSNRSSAPGDGPLLPEHGASSGGSGDGTGDAGGPSDPGGHEGGEGEEWGDFNAAVARRQWRSILRAAPGSTRHVLMHLDDDSPSAPTAPGAATNGTSGDGADAAAAASGSAAGSAAWHGSVSTGGALTAAPSRDSQHSFAGGVPSQPIPVPGSSSAGGAGGRAGPGSASASVFAAAAAAAAVASGKPPLPPRCSSTMDRGGGGGGAPPAAAAMPALGPFSRLSVVAEDPLAVQMGPVAPAPSPRGSMDLHVCMGRSGSQQLDGCEHNGYLLCAGSFGAPGGGTGSAAVVGSASCNGDCASGTASVTTAGGLLLSPSGASGPVSPHAMSPKMFVSGWRVSGGGAGGGGGGGTGGSDTPTMGYMPIGLERVPSTALYDNPGNNVSSNGGAAGIAAAGGALDGTAAAAAAAASLLDRSLSLGMPLVVPPVVVPPPPEMHLLSMVDDELLPLHQQLTSPQCASNSESQQQQQQQQQQQSSDMATDIAGDILRMLSAVDTGNANAAYDPRVVLGESMYADSPSKEESKLVRPGSEALRHLPSSSALAELAAQDLARAQEEAERVRQELEAQLMQQRAAERASSAGAAADAAAEPAAAADGTAAAAAGAAAIVGTETCSFGGPHGTASAAGDAGNTAAGGLAQDGSSAQPSGGGTSGGAGNDELVFRRPRLYVDGIPMFDPKSLMTDSHEAQVMFTPTVSPGASSYADPHLAGFTPTGGDLTPADPDNLTAATTPSGAVTAPGDPRDTWRDPPGAAEEGAAAEPSASPAAAAVAAVSAVSVFASAATAAAVAASGNDMKSPAGDGAQGDALEAGAGAGGAQSAAAAVSTGCGVQRESSAAAGVAACGLSSEQAPGGEGTRTTVAASRGPPGGADGSGRVLSHLPSASEWVDWSQAPPIVAATSVVLSVTELASFRDGISAAATGAAAAAAGCTAVSDDDAGGLRALPSDWESASEYDSDVDDEDEEEEEAAAGNGSTAVAGGTTTTTTGFSLETSQPTGPPSGEASVTAPLERDLIDMASPARPLGPSGAPSGLGSYHQLPSGHRTHAASASGTGLSPIAGSGQFTARQRSRGHSHSHHHQHHDHHQHHSGMIGQAPELALQPSAAAASEGARPAVEASLDSGQGSFVRPLMYGLLPMTSDMPSCGPPPAPCLSFASTASFVSGAGSSFSGPAGGGPRPQAAPRPAVGAHAVPPAAAAAEPALPDAHREAVSVPPPVQCRPVAAAASVATAVGPLTSHAADDGVAQPGGLDPAEAASTTPACGAALILDSEAAAARALVETAPGAGCKQGLALATQAPAAAAAAEAHGEAPAAAGAEPAPEDCQQPLRPPATSPNHQSPVSPQQQQQQRFLPEPLGELLLQHEASAGATVEVLAEASLELLVVGDRGALEQEPSGTSAASEATVEIATGTATAVGAAEAPVATPEPGSRPTGRSLASGSPPPVSPMEGQGSGEMGEAGDEVESSPFRAALSPSLAHHIMSAYLRCEEHQQQQEQRELQEKMMQQEQEHQHQQQNCDQHQFHGADEGLGLGQEAGRLSVTAIPTLPLGVMAHETVAAQPPTTTTAATSYSQLTIGASGGPVGLLLAEEISLGPAAMAGGSATASALASPVLGSPSRVPPPAAAALAAGLPGCTATSVRKALTPFAVSLDDPAMCRLSVEVLQALPPPPPPPPTVVLAHPETPNPGFGSMMGSGAITGPAAAVSGADGRMHTTGSVTLGSLLRAPGSGEASEAAAAALAGAAACGGAGSGALSGLGGSNGLPRPSCGGMLPLHAFAHAHPQVHVPAGLHSAPGVVSFGSHDLPLSAGGAGVSPTLPLSAEPGGGGGAGAAAAAHAGVHVHGHAHLISHPPLVHTCSARVWSSSAGGAVPPLLPPPPPPQVPLCQAATLAAAAAAAAAAASVAACTRASESASAPAAHPSSQSVLCSSNSTLVCVQPSGISACTPVGTGSCSSGGAAEPVTAASTAAAVATVCGTVPPAPTTLAPAPPSWTATFDGVDESATSDDHKARNISSDDGGCGGGCGGGGPGPRVGQPRVLASAFAAEASTASSAEAGGDAAALTPPPASLTLRASGGLMSGGGDV